MKKLIWILTILLPVLALHADTIPETGFDCEVSDTSLDNRFSWQITRGEARYFRVNFYQYTTNMSIEDGDGTCTLNLKASDSTNRYALTGSLYSATNGIIRVLWPSSNAVPAATYQAEFGVPKSPDINLAAKGTIKVVKGTGDDCVSTNIPWFAYLEHDPTFSKFTNGIAPFHFRPTVNGSNVFLIGETAGTALVANVANGVGPNVSNAFYLSINPAGYISSVSTQNSAKTTDNNIWSGATNLYSGSISLGQLCVASNNSFAEGQYTLAIGNRSHAEGVSTISKGAQSHAEGYSCIASGGDSHAEGVYTIASGGSSHSDGQMALAKDNYSYVWGSDAFGGIYYLSHGLGSYNIFATGGVWIGKTKIGDTNGINTTTITLTGLPATTNGLTIGQLWRSGSNVFIFGF